MVLKVDLYLSDHRDDDRRRRHLRQIDQHETLAEKAIHHPIIKNRKGMNTMISDQRPMAAKRLVEYIKENPTSSNIILTASRFRNNWSRLVLDNMKELDIRFLAPTWHLPIIIEGNENKHQPTVHILKCGSEDIRGRSVTGVLLLDIFFLKETPRMRKSFEAMAEYKKEEWFHKNTPLTLHIETVLRPALGKDAQVWTVGENENLTPYFLDSLFPDNR